MTLAMAVGFQGCTDDQVDAVGEAVIIAGAIVVAANSHCVAGYKQVCHTYVNYYGNQITECRQEWDDCAYVVPNNGFAASAHSTNPIDLVTPVKWGDTFSIGFDASGKLIEALKETQTGKIDQIEALGLTRDDLVDIALYRMPPDASLGMLARSLDASPSATRTMLEKILAQMKSEPNPAK